MKIKCVKNKIDAKSHYSILNKDMSDYLTIGKTFWVYGLRFSEHCNYVYIYNEEHLVEVPMEMFEIVDSKVSVEWIVKAQGVQEVMLWPNLFYIDDFLENFAEREMKERNEFNKLKAIIEVE